MPMAGLEIEREVILSPFDAVAVVKESVTNVKELGRVYNMVQHPTIAVPFLDENTLVDCNGKRGFAQGPNRTYSATPEKPTVEFPRSVNRAGEEANARHMTGGDDDVQSYEVEPGSPVGWICATSPAAGLLLGYVWPAADYPWISLWCCSRGGRACARGLEFGTTGLHQPFPILSRHPRIFDLPTSQYIDAGETQTRSYGLFLARVPADFRGVASLALEGTKLVAKERDGGRTVTLETGETGELLLGARATL